MSLTSGVQILRRGFLHHPILWSWIRLSDGSTPTTMASMVALLYVDIIWTFRDTSEFRFFYLHPTNRTFRALSLTSGVQLLGCGFLQHPILWSRISLSDGLITTMMSYMMAWLYVDVIRTFHVLKMTRTRPHLGSLICAQPVFLQLVRVFLMFCNSL